VSVDAELTRIWERHGKVTAELVVAEATPEGSVLHDRFEWDDRAAGHAWRLVQARELIRSVKVVFVSPDGPREVRRFVSVRVGPEPDAGYQPVERVLADPVSGEIALARLRAAIRALERNYGHLAEFREVLTGALDGAGT
jgi:hypothetical protein